jgi:hypothetical protein
MYSKILWLLFVVSIQIKAQVTVFPFPKNAYKFTPKSTEYQVFVLQKGTIKESFVYSSETNFEKPELQSNWNHWTTFEASNKVEIIIKKLNGDIQESTIFPARLGIKPTINQNEIRLNVTPPCKLFVDLKGMEEHPLFIFVDSPEKQIPSKNDKNVIWFEAGKVHNVGLQYKVPNGSTVYVEGGAVVWGTFVCEDGPLKTTIRGRGVITTRSSERKPNAENIPFCSIYGVKTDLDIEGVTITDPVKFCILGRKKVETKNVKLFAWYHQTDGWGGGDDSWIDDSFMKVFDDNVKLYGNNQKATNLTIYQQHNGAPFQLSWGGQSGQNCTVENVDIVKCWVDKKGGVGNSALLNLRKGSDKPIGNITIKNVNADQGIYQLIGILNDKGSKVENITLENINIQKSQFQKNYINNLQNSQTVGLNFKNVKIDGKCIRTEEFATSGYEVKDLNLNCQ